MSRRAVDTRHRVKPTTRNIRVRTLIVFGVLFLVCGILLGKIIKLNYEKKDDYQKKVLAQQSYISNVIPYRRGDIVDRNGNKLATSRKVYNLILDPFLILEDSKYNEPTQQALYKVFGISKEEFDRILEENTSSRYYQMKEYKELESDTVEEMEKLMDDDTNIKGVWFEEEYKREYPYSTVASDVIGFCSDTNTGAWGIENQYNTELNGTYGRSYGYFDSDLNLVQTVKAASNGYTIVSTLDVNIQGIMEQHIQKFMDQTGAKNMGCIIMNPNNGEIYAMGSDPVYDLNNPRDLTKYYTKQELDEMSKEDKLDAMNELWRNYCISDSYEPGSTFKPITVAACLDEGATSDSRTYVCDGGQEVADYYIKCVAHSQGGHGTLTARQALMYSCNDVMMQMSADLTRNKFLDYINLFGYGKRTGIDLPGEATGSVFTSESMHETELATSSFGQGQTVTMIQMAAAFSAVVNGGNYYQPHVVKEIDSESGAVIHSDENALESKVITEETSRLIRTYLRETVESGTANPASVKGYKVGGKTGTAEKHPTGRGNYLVSFIGCVPADNPQMVIYVVIDEPNVEDQAHSTFATEFASDLMEDILPMLEIYPGKAGKGDSGDSQTAEGDEEGESDEKLHLPSTQNGNDYLEVPKDGYVDGEYPMAEEEGSEEEGSEENPEEEGSGEEETQGEE